MSEGLGVRSDPTGRLRAVFGDLTRGAFDWVADDVDRKMKNVRAIYANVVVGSVRASPRTGGRGRRGGAAGVGGVEGVKAITEKLRTGRSSQRWTRPSRALRQSPRTTPGKSRGG